MPVDSKKRYARYNGSEKGRMRKLAWWRRQQAIKRLKATLLAEFSAKYDHPTADATEFLQWVIAQVIAGTEEEKILFLEVTRAIARAHKESEQAAAERLRTRLSIESIQSIASQLLSSDASVYLRDL